MTPEAFRESLTAGKAAERTALIEGLSGPDVLRLEGALFGLHLQQIATQVSD